VGICTDTIEYQVPRKPPGPPSLHM
jgi:hypothetical protein